MQMKPKPAASLLALRSLRLRRLGKAGFVFFAAKGLLWLLLPLAGYLIR